MACFPVVGNMALSPGIVTILTVKCSSCLESSCKSFRDYQGHPSDGLFLLCRLAGHLLSQSLWAASVNSCKDCRYPEIKRKIQKSTKLIYIINYQTVLKILPWSRKDKSLKKIYTYICKSLLLKTVQTTICKHFYLQNYHHTLADKNLDLSSVAERHRWKK